MLKFNYIYILVNTVGLKQLSVKFELTVSLSLFIFNEYDKNGK